MSDLEGSNALVSVVQFYSQALGRSEEARRQLEATLKQVLVQRPPPPPWMKVVRAADDYIEAQHTGTAEDRQKTLEQLEKLVYDVRRIHEMDRVEPVAAREGSVRGATADGPPDVPG